MFIGVSQYTFNTMPFYLLWCLCVRVDEGSEERLVYSVESNSTLLECVPRSLQAKVLWFFHKEDEKHEVSLTHL